MASEIRVNKITNRSGLSTATWNDEGIDVVGIVTATSFSGSITGSTGTFGGDVTISGDLGVGGTITYEDVARVDATGISTFREGFKLGPITGVALTAYNDGSIRSTGIITATSYYGDGSNLTGIDASSIKYNNNVKIQANNSGIIITGITTVEGTGGIKMPRGTTTERPSVGSTSNYMRYNTTNSALEFYNGTGWVELVGEYNPTSSFILG